MELMRSNDKKEIALQLYLKDTYTIKEIAEKVNVTPKTLAKWRDENNWDTHKASIIITKKEELSRLYQQLKNLNDFIMAKEEGHRYASSSEADTISKLGAAIKSLETETSIAETIDVFVNFQEWIRDVDLQKAKEISEIQDAYIKHKLSK